MIKKCVNIDWLEVFCLEPLSINKKGRNTAEVIEKKGYTVRKREYGTPIYNEVLFVYEQGIEHTPIFEIRRNPRQSEGKNILQQNACHIRLTNQYCYSEHPIQLIQNFIIELEYTYKQIKRIDLCVDFNKFDNNMSPSQFLSLFMSNRISKLHQSNVALHGVDRWDGRYWNSIKWGSTSSNITTKLYNKTLEMCQTKMKSYIQEHWRLAGLDISSNVWRVEFSINAARKGFMNIKQQDMYKMKLTDFDTRDKCLFIFNILSQKYFNFKYVELNKDGTFKRKDRCKSLELFKLRLLEQAYTTKDLKITKDPDRISKILMNRCRQLSQDKELDEITRKSASNLFKYYYEIFDRYWGT